MNVRYVPAMNLRIGDIVVPDEGRPRRVTMHRIEGAHPYVVVAYEGHPRTHNHLPTRVPRTGASPPSHPPRRLTTNEYRRPKL